jgi:cytochrome c oxidase subunit 3
MSDVPLQAEEHVHHPFLQHQFEDMGQQHEASTLGMWMFLATEILFFGGVLMAYWVYRIIYPEAWAVAGGLQNTLAGGINTLVLITSSFTMASAVRAAQLGSRRLTVGLLLTTMFFGFCFLGIKGLEYFQHWHEGLFPGAHFTWHELPDFAPKVQLFMVFYWGMTGLHALHMIIGIGLLSWIIWRAQKGQFSAAYYSPVEVMGLYWHFVDIVWIFLFPFLYLIPHFGVPHV